MNVVLAFRVFFAILLGWPLPEEILALPGAKGLLPEPKKEPVTEPPALEPPKPVKEPPPPEKVPPVKEPAVPPPPPPPAAPDPRKLEAAAVQVLAVLQSEGRLLDFLSEDIEGYGDADIGAAVRDVHKGLRRALADHFPVKPLRTEEEESNITVPSGFDPAAVRLTGNVVGAPPFNGKLKHRGWKVENVRLPRLPDGDAAKIIAPAEVEV